MYNAQYAEERRDNRFTHRHAVPIKQFERYDTFRVGITVNYSLGTRNIGARPAGRPPDKYTLTGRGYSCYTGRRSTVLEKPTKVRRLSVALSSGARVCSLSPVFVPFNPLYSRPSVDWKTLSISTIAVPRPYNSVYITNGHWTKREINY